MGSNDRRFEKGFFTPGRLPVSDKHVRAPGRGRLYLVGAVGALLVVALLGADAFVGRAATVARGPLSSSHALFASECSTCHVPMEGVPDAKCESCHEKFGGDMRAYGFERHYVYESGNVDRSAPSTRELSCASCHREHQGRDASLQRVADATCAGCHEFDSFGKEHPEFAFAAEGRADPANLRFPHVLHVRELMEEHGLVDAEAACIRCHTPEPDGRSFQPLSFALQCDECHMSPTTATPYLPSSGEGPRVATLGEIRQSGGPGARWADLWNPNEFTERGGQVQKRPLYHADPWVLHNLNKLRSELYPGAELADLLRTSAELPARDVRRLHREAITTLRSQIEALRGDPSPEVQRELTVLSALLAQVEARVERPFEPLDETRFAVGLADRPSGAETGALDVEAYRSLIADLTEPCQTCHLVENATVRRVQTDQRSLVRAQFDHRAHVVHARCLDCHGAIPVREALASGEDVPAEQDHAGIVNLPTIATCRSCHTARQAPDRCTSCHLFHPDKSHWATLSR